MHGRSSDPAGRAHPSTAALRMFLAVAAEGSTARAAERIHLTQSAVSKQILGLEAQLGVALFERSANGLKLTESGELYRPYAEAALEQLSRGARRILERQAAGTPIRLHMVAIVGERWLMERFPAFAAAHPDIDVQFTNYVSETATEEPDLVIRYGAGPWPNEDCRYLFGRQVSLVAAPGLLERSGDFATAGDVQRMTYLQHFQMPTFWAELTEASGLRGAVPARTVRYGYFSVIIKAAVSGLGVALVPTCFIRDELRDGRLVNPLDLTFDSASGCWLSIARRHAPAPPVDILVDWLTREALAFDDRA
jgi:LysR family transcriptional regulator, glycine cleavage system transcriptional activator